MRWKEKFKEKYQGICQKKIEKKGKWNSLRELKERLTEKKNKI